MIGTDTVNFQWGRPANVTVLIAASRYDEPLPHYVPVRDGIVFNYRVGFYFYGFFLGVTVWNRQG
jgi:hypothetical protein